MPLLSRPEVVYAFPYGERHQHDVISAVQIETLAEARPGLYAWYLRLLPKAVAETNLSTYARFFGSKQMSSKLKAYLGELYQGTLALVPAFDSPRAAIRTLLATAAAVFAPAVYIGIAKNMRTRLVTHRRHLEDALAGTIVSDADKSDSDETKPNVALDSDEESSFF